MSSRKATLEQVMADRLEAMGEEPSSETLLAWRQGRLDESEREQLLERAAVDPAFARELLDTLDFPELPAEQPWDAPTRERKWQRFTERMRAEGVWADEAADEASSTREGVDPPVTFPTSVAGSARRAGAWGRLPLAASLLIGVLLGATLYRVVDGPATPVPALRNVESLALAFDHEAGGRGSVAEIKASAEWLQLVFSASALPVAERYGLRVLDVTGREVYRQAGLVPGTGARLTALVPIEDLAAGGYRAKLYPGDDFDAEAVATANWIVTFESP